MVQCTSHFRGHHQYNRCHFRVKTKTFLSICLHKATCSNNGSILKIKSGGQ